MSPSVLLATCADLPAGDEDAKTLTAALGRHDVEACWAIWTDPGVDCDAALVVLRTTWVYATDRDRFVEWVSGLARVVNSADVVAWNTDKIYLRGAGVPIVATTFAAPDEDVELTDVAEMVVKPPVGAGSRGVGRFTADRRADARDHAAALHAAGRTVLIQPYLDAVDIVGETALIYLDGRFSHAIRKGPMLPACTTHPVDGWELYVEERITARRPEPADRFAAAIAALA